jgi:hypothetical protein
MVSNHALENPQHDVLHIRMKITMLKLLIQIGFFLALIITANSAYAAPSTWPQIKPLERVVQFDAAHQRAEVSVKSPDGKDLYVLDCFHPGFDDDEPNYAELLRCSFSPVSHKFDSLLISQREYDDNARIKRGSFSYAQAVQGMCKQDALYGSHRVFNLRGLRLELSIRNFRYNGKNEDWRETIVWESLDVSGLYRHYGIQYALHVKVTQQPTENASRVRFYPTRCSWYDMSLDKYD